MTLRRDRAHPDLMGWLATRPAALRVGPLAVILCEDDVLVGETLDHHLSRGFRHLLALSPEPLDPALIPDGGRVTNLRWDTRASAAHVPALAAVITAVAPGTWLFYAFNAEFLFFPFCETRRIGEALAFHAEERRHAMACIMADLYPEAGSDLTKDRALLDARGYFALHRADSGGTGYGEGQVDLHGGLRWRMADRIPPASRRLDRIALFRAAKGLQIGADHRTNRPDDNRLSCPWHHNMTAAIASFRVAKALLRNPATRDGITRLDGPNSVPFAWSSAQLLDLGLIEPGQWF